MTVPATIRQFTLAGLATLTLKSLRTETHYTYKVKQAPADEATGEEKALWFVSVLADSDRYMYVGCIAGAAENFKLTGGSKFTEAAGCTKAWRYFWAGIQAGVIKPELEIRHSGNCGRCNRPLTTPTSIDIGIGPICLEQMGL